MGRSRLWLGTTAASCWVAAGVPEAAVAGPGEEASAASEALLLAASSAADSRAVKGFSSSSSSPPADDPEPLAEEAMAAVGLRQGVCSTSHPNDMDVLSGSTMMTGILGR